ncbi:MAG: GNAT family N-acetyltransferase [Gemmatimonadetes bacterium]|nr:GNAT family N-acetyltransferase [Gemmatimonadota bacterium]
MLTTSQSTGAAARALIRGATAADYDAVAQLLTDSELPLDGVREALPSFLLAESAGQLVGVAGLEVCCEHALLRSVAVAPAWRSRGLGRELITRVIAGAESRGIRALYLLTNTAESYFPSFGFEKIARDEVPADVQSTSEFQGACPASATIMRRALSRARPGAS